MESQEYTTTVCTILAIDHTSLTYKACPVCERTQLDPSSSINFPMSANSATPNPSTFPPPTSRSNDYFESWFVNFSRLKEKISIAINPKVITVIFFDRVAKVLFGCSSDEFFDFAKLHPLSGPMVNEMLEGDLFRMTLSKPKNGNARHLRVVSAIPLRTGFRPAIEALIEYHRR